MTHLIDVTCGFLGVVLDFNKQGDKMKVYRYPEHPCFMPTSLADSLSVVCEKMVLANASLGMEGSSRAGKKAVYGM